MLYEIVHEEPAALTGLRTGVPVELEFIVGECLAKDRDDRTGTAQEVSRKLRTLAEKLKSGHSTILRTSNLTAGVPATMTGAHTLNPAEALPPGAVIVQQSSHRAAQALAAVATLALLALAFVHFTQAPPPTPLRRFSFAPDAYTQDSSYISPDGKFILYRAGTGAQNSLWLRSLENESARELAGTIGANNWAFWSPDSLSIGFATGNELKRVPINGGDPITLCQLPGASYPFLGGTWSPDGERIVVSSGFRLYEIAARGGEPEMLFEPGEGQRRNYWNPHFLPTDGGSHGLAYVAAVGLADQMLAVMDLETGERRELGPGSRPGYSSDGYLIHGPMNPQEGGLRALPFSLDTLEATGQSFPIDETGRFASVSRDGSLVYTDSPTGGSRQLVIRDRSGEILQSVDSSLGGLPSPAVSPDGRSVAFGVDGDIWVYDLNRDVRARLTSSSEVGEHSAFWPSSSEELSYGSRGDQGNQVMSQVADGSVASRTLLETTRTLVTLDWSSDGQYLVYNAIPGADAPEGEEGGISVPRTGP